MGAGGVAKPASDAGDEEPEGLPGKTATAGLGRRKEFANGVRTRAKDTGDGQEEADPELKASEIMRHDHRAKLTERVYRPWEKVSDWFGGRSNRAYREEWREDPASERTAMFRNGGLCTSLQPPLPHGTV
jgi:hypothetical protein